MPCLQLLCGRNSHCVIRFAYDILLQGPLGDITTVLGAQNAATAHGEPNVLVALLILFPAGKDFYFLWRWSFDFGKEDY